MTFNQLVKRIDDAFPPEGHLLLAARRLARRSPAPVAPADVVLAHAVVAELRGAFESDDGTDEGRQLRLVLDVADSMVRDLEGLRERLHEMWSPLAEAAGR